MCLSLLVYSSTGDDKVGPTGPMLSIVQPLLYKYNVLAYLDGHNHYLNVSAVIVSSRVRPEMLILYFEHTAHSVQRNKLRNQRSRWQPARHADSHLHQERDLQLSHLAEVCLQLRRVRRVHRPGDGRDLDLRQREWRGPLHDPAHPLQLHSKRRLHAPTYIQTHSGPERPIVRRVPVHR